MHGRETNMLHQNSERSSFPWTFHKYLVQPSMCVPSAQAQFSPFQLFFCCHFCWDISKGCLLSGHLSLGWMLPMG